MPLRRPDARANLLAATFMDLQAHLRTYFRAHFRACLPYGINILQFNNRKMG